MLLPRRSLLSTLGVSSGTYTPVPDSSAVGASSSLKTCRLWSQKADVAASTLD